ncbi:hypothetical protein ABZR86_10310 [Dyella marensis]|nr:MULTISPECIES: hypothetical protein [Dyella]
MRAILLIFVAALVIFTCGQPAAASPWGTDCAARASQVSIRPSGRRDADFDGKMLPYGVFVLSNGSGKSIAVLADIYKQKYWMVHPNYLSLQRKEGDSWKDVVWTLSEYAGPDKKVVVPRGEEWQFFYALDELVSSGVGRTQEFRLVLRDVNNCKIPSDSFTLESLGKLEAEK